MDNNKNENKISFIDSIFTAVTAFILALIIIILSVFTVFRTPKEFSENENRALATKPQYSFSSLIDGRYMTEVEDYLNDQFITRDNAIRLKTAIDLFVGKIEIGDVYVGKKHFLFEKNSPYTKQTDNTIKSINRFTKNHKKLNSYIAIAPNASELLSDYLPKNAPRENQTKQIKKVYSKLDNSIHTVDLCAALKKAENPEELYYKTDHHWTTPAARLAFLRIAKDMKIKVPNNTYTSYAVSDSFCGTMASSAGLFTAKDTIYIRTPNSKKLQYIVEYVNEDKKLTSPFVSAKLETKNKYEVFFGGNFAQINISTNVNSQRVLLLFKDSYANCLVPMLIPHFKTIVMIDPRYYAEDINETIKKEGVTDVLWLYNANTFLADTSINSIME